jgi:hypothetical protein
MWRSWRRGTSFRHIKTRAAWDCSGFHGEMDHVNKPVPNSTPETALTELLSKVRFVFGEKPWEDRRWEAREFGTGTPRTLRLPCARAPGTESPGGKTRSSTTLPLDERAVPKVGTVQREQVEYEHGERGTGADRKLHRSHTFWLRR